MNLEGKREEKEEKVLLNSLARVEFELTSLTSGRLEGRLILELRSRGAYNCPSNS